jgi:hypothetical protein
MRRPPLPRPFRLDPQRRRRGPRPRPFARFDRRRPPHGPAARRPSRHPRSRPPCRSSGRRLQRWQPPPLLRLLPRSHRRQRRRPPRRRQSRRSRSLNLALSRRHPRSPGLGRALQRLPRRRRSTKTSRSPRNRPTALRWRRHTPRSPGRHSSLPSDSTGAWRPKLASTRRPALVFRLGMTIFVILDKEASSLPAKRVRTSDARVRALLAVATIFFGCAARVGCVGCGCDPGRVHRDHDGDRGHYDRRR